MAEHGFRSLGQILAGGDPTVGTPSNKAFLEGLSTGSLVRARNASTENALQLARKRRDEAAAREEFKTLSSELDIDPAFIAATQAGFDPRQFTGAEADVQIGGFRESIADVGIPFEERQAAAQAIQGQVVDPFQFGPGGELFTDVFKPELQTSPTGEAQIALDVQRTEKARQDAALAEAKRKNPGAFKSSFFLGTSPEGVGLGDQILADLAPSQIPSDVQPGLATGLRGIGRAAGNFIFDIAEANLPFPEASIATEAMGQLAKRITIVGQQAMPGRPNVKLIDLLASFGVEPNDIKRGNQRSIDLLRQTKLFLDSEVDSTVRQLNAGRLTPGKVVEFEKGLRGLAGLKQDVDVILSRFDATTGQTSAGGTTFTLSEE